MSQSYPYSDAEFKVSFEGIDAFPSTRISGLSMHTEVLVGDTDASKLPEYRKGKTFCSDIEITRLFRGQLDLFEWFKECQHGAPVKRSGSIILMTDDKKEGLRFNFVEAWPVRWDGPVLTSGAFAGVATESLRLVIQDLTINKTNGVI